MKVRLDDIPPEGLSVTFADTLARAEDFGPQVEAIQKPAQAELFLERGKDLVTARGEYQAALALACSRCLRPYTVSLSGPVSWAFRPQPGSQDEEVRLDGDDLDVIFFSGQEIDLAQALRDEMSLALPMAPLCREECAGICPNCGKPVAPGEKCCAQAEADPRWAALAKLKE